MQHFGTTAAGEDVHKLVLQDGALRVAILTWGAAVQDVRLDGVAHGLTLGSHRIADYEGGMAHHGTLIGPIVNRISVSRVELDGMVYELERNQDGRIHLHSGKQATHRRVWQVVDHGPTFATLQCKLGDGDCGLPGNRIITARYCVQAPACLTLDINATTDALTLFNFANHSYWNFDGSDRWDGHILKVQADRFLPTTRDDTPTGDISDVTDTPMDFRTARAITPGHPPLDNNFCLSDAPADLRRVLTLTGASGVGMHLATNQPGVQVYDGRNAIRPDKAPFEGLAIEAQGWPDAPTHAGFPTIRATADHPYQQTTQFDFFTPAT